MGLGRVLLRSNESGAADVAPGLSWFPSGRVLPVPVTEESAQAVPPFWRGLAYVTGTVGMLPASALRGTDEIDPQPTVLVQPDPRTTAISFWSETVRSLVLYGNAVSLITARDRLGFPSALRAIHPRDVSVQFLGNPSEPDIGAWYLMGREVDPSNIWHVRSFIGRTGWPLGIGLIDGVAEGISLAQALQDYAAGYFIGGAMPSAVIKVNRPELTTADADEVRTNFMGKFGGPRRQPAVLNSLTDVVPMASNPSESQLVEARQLSVADCALLFGLPPSKLGGQSPGMTYRNAEQEEIQARNDAIAPWARLLEQAVTLDLLPRGQRCVWNLDAYMRADTLTRYQAHAIALAGAPWEIVDEVREIEGLDPIADVLGAGATSAIPAPGETESTSATGAETAGALAN